MATVQTTGFARNQIQGLLVDLDGVVWIGEHLTEGATAFWAYVCSAGLPVAFVSNAASRSRQDILRKLRRLGIEAQESQIHTATQAAAVAIAEQQQDARVFVLGGAGLVDELIQVGAHSVEQDAQFVVVGRDQHVTFARLEQACREVLAGAQLIGLSTDRLAITNSGLSPGTGAFVAFIETCTATQAQIVGKPEPPLFLLALDALGLDPAVVAMVGDTHEIDIIGAQRVGMRSILIAEINPNTTPQADLLCRDLADLTCWLQLGDRAADARSDAARLPEPTRHDNT